MEKEYTDKLLKCLYEVHNVLGPGLPSRIYEEAAARELTANGFSVKRQVAVPVTYKGELLEGEVIVDMVVDDKVLLDIQSVTEISKLSEKQLFSFLLVADCELGYIVIFNVVEPQEGIFSVYNYRKGRRKKTATKQS